MEKRRISLNSPGGWQDRPGVTFSSSLGLALAVCAVLQWPHESRLHVMYSCSDTQTNNQDYITEQDTAMVNLVPMEQLAEAKSADDDWTGLKDQAERRKRQTRLALRAYSMCHQFSLHESCTYMFYVRSSGRLIRTQESGKQP